MAVATVARRRIATRGLGRWGGGVVVTAGFAGAWMSAVVPVFLGGLRRAPSHLTARQV